MITFIAILGVIFIFVIIAFMNSSQFKEVQNKHKKQNTNPPFIGKTSNRNLPYYGNVGQIRTDGYYFLKGQNDIHVYALLPNNKVSWFSEFTMGNTIAERMFFSKAIHDNISNSISWAEQTTIQGNEIVSVIKRSNKTYVLKAKLKSNGQLQLFLTYKDYDDEKVTEWYDYEFIEYGKY